MKILHVIPGDLWAGAEAQVYYTLKEIQKFKKHKVSVIVFSNGELLQRLMIDGIDVTLLDETRMSSVAICDGIRKKLLQEEVQIAHVHEYKSHILTTIAKIIARKKILLFRTQHGQNIPNRFKSHLILGCEKIFVKYFTDHLIAVSEQLKNLLSRKLTKADIHLIYNAVNLGSLPLPNDISKVRKSFGIQENQFWIGTAARLEEVKNIQMLIASASYLKNNHPELSFRISIFGEGSLRKILEAQILQYGLVNQVFLEGQNNNILPVLQSFDVFTLTSLHEGLPMSLLEAMSVGTVSVCTAVGGMQEVLAHGEDGFLVSSDNAEELADIFAYIYSNRANINSFRLKAFEKIEQLYSIEQSCQKLLSLYGQSLEKGSS
jgi:L-malate glycosyltransferase